MGLPVKSILDKETPMPFQFNRPDRTAVCGDHLQSIPWKGRSACGQPRGGGGGWDSLTANLLDSVRAAYAPKDRDQLALLKAARLVNHHWHRWANEAMTFLAPKDAPLASLLTILEVRFTNLCGLDLSGCQSDVAWLPTLLPRLPNLVHLSLDGCCVTDASLRELHACTGLQELDLSNCKQVGDQGLALVAQISSLCRLQLRVCPLITDKGVGVLTSLVNLELLDLACRGRLSLPGLYYPRCPSNVSSKGFVCLSSLTRLSSLSLRDCFRITDTVVGALSTLTNLKHIDLSFCARIRDGSLRVLGGLPSLEHIDLEGSFGIGDAGVRQLSSLTNLRHLCLSDCNGEADHGGTAFGRGVTDEGFGWLGTITSLQHLKVRRCENVTDTGVARLSSLTNLTFLDLSNSRNCTAIKETGLAALCSLAGLRTLRLCNCVPQVSDECARRLGRMSRLTSLSLVGSQLSDVGLKCLFGLTGLTLLDLSGCQGFRRHCLKRLHGSAFVERFPGQLWTARGQLSGCEGELR